LMFCNIFHKNPPTGVKDLDGMCGDGFVE